MNYITRMNLLIAEAKQTISAARVKGRAFEYVAALAGGRMKGISLEELENFIRNEAVVGDVRSKTQYNFDATKILKSSLLENVDTLTQVENLIISTKASQNKIDVHFEVGGEDIRISAKNYNLNPNSIYKTISAVKGAPLLSMLSSYNDLMYHYLNINSLEGTFPGQRQVYSAVKMVCIFHALAGGAG